MHFPSFTLVPLLRVLSEYRPFPRQRVLRVGKFFSALARPFLRRVELALVLGVDIDILFEYAFRIMLPCKFTDIRKFFSVKYPVTSRYFFADNTFGFVYEIRMV